MCSFRGSLFYISVLMRCKLFCLFLFLDANECEMFGSEICKNGQCSNLFATYTCYCRSGFFYDNIRLECVGENFQLRKKTLQN